MSNEESTERSVIVIGSANGSTNLGDEAMWLAAAQAVREHAPDAHLVTDCFPGWRTPVDNVSTLPFFHETYYRWGGTPGSRASAALRLLVNRGALSRGLARAERFTAGETPRNQIETAWDSAIRSSSALVIAGAGGITDQHALHGIAGWHAVVGRAHHHSRPVALFGQGIGPVRDPELVRATARMLSMVDIVTTRDTESANLAQQLAPGVRVVDAPDWALMLTPSASTQLAAKEFASSEFSDSPFMGLSLHADRTASPPALRSVVEQAAKLAEKLISKGFGLLLVPNMTVKRRSDDRQILRRVQQRISERARHRAVLLEHSNGPSFTAALLGMSVLVISTRYHPVIFGLMEGTPCVGLSFNPYYDQKLTGALRWYGEDDRVLPVSRMYDLIDSADSLLDGRQRRLDRTQVLRTQVRASAEPWLTETLGRR